MDIKFRAISVKTGEMIFGSYVTDGKDYHAIVYPDITDDSMMMNEPIDLKTLGQFIGITDINKVDVYTGDILGGGEVNFYSNLSWEGGGSEHSGFFVSNGFEYGGDNSGNDDDMEYHVTMCAREVTGNIHEVVK